MKNDGQTIVQRGTPNLHRTFLHDAPAFYSDNIHPPIYAIFPKKDLKNRFIYKYYKHDTSK